MSESDTDFEDQITPERERVFELSEVALPKRCERCNIRRPKSCLVKRVMGSPMSLAFLCGSCSTTVKAQASEAALRIKADLESQGVEVDT